ncbi:MAG: glutathione synthase [Rhodospirillaceae bacterium]|nr:glutathione synthase [Rhodospirillaceae bacterium]|tara:strand:+ start:6479 stop:7429 length:951 start_codon:yes stop_codon:yes gene_type:complete
MSQLIGIVMDPIETIQPEKDSTHAIMLAAQCKGWDLIYFLQNDLSVKNGIPTGTGSKLRVIDNPKKWFELGDSWAGNLDELDVILMRKDPPFNMEYIYTTYILELAEKRGSLVVNKPSSLRNINEKAYTSWFPHCTPPSLITRSKASIKSFIEENEKVVLKPLDGMGGRSIFVVAEGSLNTNVIIETLTCNETCYTLAQRYIPEISEGDKRILLIDGVPLDYVLARIPAPGETRGNLVAGAKGEGRKLTDRDRWICSEIGPTLKKQGVLFAGLDIIGDYLTEVNITSPTGIRELDKQYDLNIADMLLDAIEKTLSK